ncbi:MAG: hypothetical protein KBH06_00910 [Spirochaetes bacterium]|nr:hypothetical protein [Spirochaetota bacterium]
MIKINRKLKFALFGVIGTAAVLALLLVGVNVYLEFDAFKSSYFSMNHNTEESIRDLLSNKDEFKDNIHIYKAVSRFDSIYNGKNTKEKYLKELWKGRKVPYTKIQNKYGMVEVCDAIITDYLSMNIGYAFAKVFIEFDKTQHTVYFNYAVRDDDFNLVKSDSVTFFIHEDKYVYLIDYFSKGDIKYEISVYNDVPYFLETQLVKETVIVKRH